MTKLDRPGHYAFQQPLLISPLKARVAYLLTWKREQFLCDDILEMQPAKYHAGAAYKNSKETLD